MRQIVGRTPGPRGRFRWHLAGAVLVLVLVAGIGTAPGTAAQEADSVRADTARVLPLPGLVVRTLRAPVPAAALPYAVTVRRLSGGAPTAGLSLDSELRAVPGLQVHSRHNEALGDRIVMRGFGARTQFGVRGVHVLVDGVPATMPDGQTTLNHLDLSLIERAEVLRGPAAAAHGNAAGGVLLLSTRPPPPSGLRQEVAAAAGGSGLLRIRGTSSGGRGPAAWVASVTREHRDGFRPHSDVERTQVTGRLDAPVAGGFLRVAAHGVSYDALNPGSLTLEQYRDDPRQAQAFNVAQATGEEGRHGQIGVGWERAIGDVTLDATLFGVARRLENPIPPTIIDLDRRTGGARLLVRSDGAAGGGPVWSVGVDAAAQADDRQNYENVAGERGERVLDQTERVTNIAVHGQALLPVRDRVGLFAGIRYDRVVFSAADRFVTASNPDDSGRRAMDAVSPTAGVRLDLSRSIAVFGNVSTAFETPTTTELVNRPEGPGGFNQELEAQRTVSYELGGRAFLSPSLRLEAIGYFARVRDALIPFEVASAPGRQFFRNAGRAVHKGFELLAELGTERLDVLAAYSRTDAAFSSYAVADRSFDGNAIPGVRPWTVGARVSGRPTRTVTLEVDYQATGEMAVDDANESRAPGYHLVGVRAAARGFRVGALEVEPYAGVDNLLDQTYVASVVPNAFGGRFFEPGPGRALYFGVGLAVTLD